MVRDGKSKKVEEEEATGFKFFKVAAVSCCCCKRLQVARSLVFGWSIQGNYSLSLDTALHQCQEVISTREN